MKKIVLSYGLISGAVSAALMFVMALYIGNDPGRFANGELMGYAGILLSLLFVFLGVRAYREKVGSGSITFGKAFEVGLLITLISCVCYVIAWTIVSKTIMTDFMQQYSTYMLDKMKSAGATEEQLRQTAGEMEHYKEVYKNPVMAAAITFLEPFPAGLLITLISAAVLRRKSR